MEWQDEQCKQHIAKYVHADVEVECLVGALELLQWLLEVEAGDVDGLRTQDLLNLELLESLARRAHAELLHEHLFFVAEHLQRSLIILVFKLFVCSLED